VPCDPALHVKQANAILIKVWYFICRTANNARYRLSALIENFFVTSHKTDPQWNSQKLVADRVHHMLTKNTACSDSRRWPWTSSVLLGILLKLDSKIFVTMSAVCLYFS